MGSRLLIVGASALLLAACTDSTAEGPVAVKLGFTLQPIATTAGAPIGPPVTVAIEDAAGNTVSRATDVVTLTIGTNPVGGTLGGTASMAAVNGVAVFSNLAINKAGTGYTLTAASTRLTAATSALFDITPGSPSQLGFTVQPGGGLAGGVITPPVQVAVRDAFGNIATQFIEKVAVSLGTNPSGATLSGTTEVNAVNGVATFSDLSIDKASAGYGLTASFGALAGATSAPFAIVAVPVIAFASSLGIEGIQTDGSGRTVLIADPAVSDPAWSPDGAKLAFSRISADFETCEIYTAAPDGSGAHQITSTLAAFPYPRCAGGPSWSPDGTKIAFGVSKGSLPPGGRIYVVNVDGSNPTLLYADSIYGWPTNPSWSPDGTELAFDCWGGDITLFVCVMNADGSSAGAGGTVGGCEWAPAWSPDGAEIAFVGSCEDGGPYTPNGPFGIWLKHPGDGSSARNLTAGDFGADESPAWSPDGTQLVFARGNPADLYVINRDGTGLRQLTSTPDISETNPAWRPATPTASAGRLALPRAKVTNARDLVESHSQEIKGRGLRPRMR
jgi:hypothetical protein